MEIWQDPDNEYLNCIGQGDTYLRRRMERIMRNGVLDTDLCVSGSIGAFGEDIETRKKPEVFTNQKKQGNGK